MLVVMLFFEEGVVAVAVAAIGALSEALEEKSKLEMLAKR